jgi:two-component system NtrC family sensor kinase
MKIRDKLFLGFSLYILLAAILGFFAYKELQTITTRLTLVEVADDITNTFLEVRRYEKNFLLFRNEDSLLEFKEYLSILKRNIDEIRVEIIREIGTDNYDMMKKTITEYDGTFNKLVDNYKLQEQIVNRLKNIGRKIEQRLKDKELEIFMNLKSLEKNLMVSKDEATYKAFVNAFESSNIIADYEVKRYRILVGRLFGLYKDERDSVDDMRLKARDIQSFTENLSRKERAGINALLEISIKLLLFALLIIIVLGTIVNIKLGMSIARPIKNLEEITKKVAGGDFSQRIEIKGRDEIASLGASFNQMEERLQETLRSLELAMQRLHEKQAQLIETEKFAVIGKFAAGVAHEINNPLAIINEKAGLMKDIIELSEDFPNKDKFLGLLDAVFNSVNRCRVITHRLLGFARRTDIIPEAIDINNLIKEVLKFLEKEILFKGIRLESNLRRDLPELETDRIQLQQVFLNIIKNAIDAVEEGGFIRISTDIKDDNIVRVSIKDNGHGIPKEILKHIFEPFFTTKEKGKGTGLGLSITYGIIKRLGGNIFVESEVNKGTTFTVEIPIKTELARRGDV